MRYITERELRDSFCNGTPDDYEVPADAKLTPAARQYLIDLRLYRHKAVPVGTARVSTDFRGAADYDANPPLNTVYKADDVKPSTNEYGARRNVKPTDISSGVKSFASEHGSMSGKPSNSSSGAKPFAPEHGSPSGAKPEHMTHLSRTELVCKADTRIELRGKLDSLEAEVLLAQLEAPENFITSLEDALSLIRRAVACDVKNEPMPDWALDGMTAEQVHRASHHPEELGFPGHPMPNVRQGRFALLLNRLRTLSRECELCSVRAYWHDGVLEHGDVVLALNRLSSYFYVLQLRAASGK